MLLLQTKSDLQFMAVGNKNPINWRRDPSYI